MTHAGSSLPLDPAMSIGVAVRRILRGSLAAMRANEDGASGDPDPEFLHDFRVAVRRTRSCLGQFKGVFEQETTKRFRKEFAWIGKRTGRKRDLDVYLVQLPDYRSQMPAALHAGLDGFETFLRREQRAEEQRVARALASRRYRELVGAWAEFLDTDPGEQAPVAAARPVRQVAAERIANAFDRVCRDGGRIDRSTPAAVVHRLRIDAKKLRYLLEFFRTVFEGRRVAPVIRALKRLQDDLGSFNDLDVQLAGLRETAAALLKGKPAEADTLLAMGSLYAVLEQRQEGIKGRLVTSVGEFVGEANRERFGVEFGAPGRGES